jgi:ACT domain-containing protein
MVSGTRGRGRPARGGTTVVEGKVPGGNIRVMAAHAAAVAEEQQHQAQERIVMAVVGRDRPGILAGVTAILANRNANILDVSQTIMSDLFTMVMLVDIKNINVPFADLKQELEEHGRQVALSIIVQHEELFRAMHRV